MSTAVVTSSHRVGKRPSHATRLQEAESFVDSLILRGATAEEIVAAYEQECELRKPAEIAAAKADAAFGRRVYRAVYPVRKATQKGYHPHVAETAEEKHAYQKQWREKHKSYQRDYYQKHRQHILANAKERYAAAPKQKQKTLAELMEGARKRWAARNQG